MLREESSRRLGKFTAGRECHGKYNIPAAKSSLRDLPWTRSTSLALRMLNSPSRRCSSNGSMMGFARGSHKRSVYVPCKPREASERLPALMQEASENLRLARRSPHAVIIVPSPSLISHQALTGAASRLPTVAFNCCSRRRPSFFCRLPSDVDGSLQGHEQRLAEFLALFWPMPIFS